MGFWLVMTGVVVKLVSRVTSTGNNGGANGATPVNPIGQTDLSHLPHISKDDATTPNPYSVDVFCILAAQSTHFISKRQVLVDTELVSCCLTSSDILCIDIIG